jgi:Tfp pilus assembly protein PilO
MINKNRLWVAGTLVAIVAVALVGWFLGISPIVAQTNNANVQRTSLETLNGTSEARVAELKEEFAGISSIEAKLTGLQESVPMTADLPVFLREVNSLTSSNDVTLGTVSIGDAQSYVAPVSATETSTDSASGSTATASPSPSPSATASTDSTSSTTATATATGPGARLVQIPISITVTGTYAKVMAFTGGVQNGDRLYFVNSVNVVQATSDSDDFTATIAGFIYVLPAAK